MKILRFELPGSPGEARIGFVDLAAGTAVDAPTVLDQVGINRTSWRAVDIVEYNTESAGALSRELAALDKFDALRCPLDQVTYLACIEAGSLRDFIAFEQHIKSVRGKRGAEVPPAWYQLPAYYKGNYRTLLGHEQPLTWPRFTEQLDYELELACIVGMEGIDIEEDQAAGYIGGYAVMND